VPVFCLLSYRQLSPCPALKFSHGTTAFHHRHHHYYCQSFRRISGKSHTTPRSRLCLRLRNSTTTASRGLADRRIGTAYYYGDVLGGCRRAEERKGRGRLPALPMLSISFSARSVSLPAPPLTLFPPAPNNTLPPAFTISISSTSSSSCSASRCQTM
jgi:hypothetical protein